VVSLGIFSEATDGTMCPGVDSASKNEHQEKFLGVKTAGRKARKSGALTYRIPKGLLRPVAGKTLPLLRKITKFTATA
jgi:hypothetical protein